MTAPTTTQSLNDHREQLPTTLADRLVARISAEHPKLSADLPARILDQTLAFLETCATATEPIGPSELVDIGWHSFILYTHEYAEFCDRIAGRFIHHAPDDGPTGGRVSDRAEGERGDAGAPRSPRCAGRGIALTSRSGP